MNTYAVYKGDNLLSVGTVHEIAEELGIKNLKTVYKYASKRYQEEHAESIERGKRKVCIKVEDDDT